MGDTLTWEWVREAYNEYMRRRGTMENHERKENDKFKAEMQRILDEQVARPTLLNP